MSNEPTQTPPPEGERMLAAILFTDVVEYSKMSGKDETRTVMVVRRDLSLMSDICRNSGGHVLKNTGDGLLMSFASAVQAMQCALEIQKTLYSESMGLPADEVVRHRMGLNLGDVIVTSDDVHGDGVNVAARLMAEAKPGAITFSRTVHDVVKGKVPMNPAYLGPRHLKHIVEPVMVWQIPSLGDEQKVAQLTAEAAEELLAGPKRSEAKGANAIVRIAVALILVALLPVILVVVLKSNTNTLKSKTPKDDGPKTPVTKPQDGTGKTKASSPPPTTTTGTAPTSPPQTADALRKKLMDDPTTAAEFKPFFTEYKFDEATAYLRTKGHTQTAAGDELAKRYSGLAEFITWLNTGLQAITQDNPVLVQVDGAEVKVWGGLKVDVNGAQAEWQLRNLAPETIVALAQGLQARNQPPPGLTNWLSDFRFETQDRVAPTN